MTSAIMALPSLIKLMILAIWSDTYLLQISASFETHEHVGVIPIAKLNIYIDY